ncbi:Hypothetical protein ORPV_1146 [Orpheovirus IHUMI-LCC2]|uniref:Uncharacterized protein n=1 Tax=Orpheovirus IHUMI-LCC2 TaxID=2023057 RepID=A0A2I2L6C8_9VIRU|nr:Hypothetical protein ORPV_1146 [Orpheovirus IHUMI-LCC2]SNW63050.1 Hypothetical protein ORPV_1146 [Orpheovirus IHUMI-LCC2]
MENKDTIINVFLQLPYGEIVRIYNNDPTAYQFVIDDDYFWKQLTERDYGNWYNVDENIKEYPKQVKNKWFQLYQRYVGYDNENENSFTLLVPVNLPNLHSKKSYEMLKTLNDLGLKYYALEKPAYLSDVSDNGREVFIHDSDMTLQLSIIDALKNQNLPAYKEVLKLLDKNSYAYKTAYERWENPDDEEDN